MCSRMVLRSSMSRSYSSSQGSRPGVIAGGFFGGIGGGGASSSGDELVAELMAAQGFMADSLVAAAGSAGVMGLAGV